MRIIFVFVVVFQVTVNAVEAILEEFKGPAGLDIDGIHLFKTSQAVDMHWTVASKHIACMQVSEILMYKQI